MSINIQSEAACRKAYLNYHCYGNTMNISPAEMGEITAAWSNRLSSWQATVSSDENQYEFDDSDYANYKDNGKQHTKDETGYSGNDTGNIVNGTLSSAAAVGSATAAGVNIASCGFRGFSQIFKPGSITNAGKTINGTGKVIKVDKVADASAYVAAALAIATAVMYRVMKPNKKEVEACKTLQEQSMPNAQVALQESQADMETMSDELVELSDEANEANEEANDNIEEEKTEFDMYKESFEALKAKAESGEPLTEDEKALYQELVTYMTESGENITETQEDTTDLVGEIYDDMGTYQEGYDLATETMGEVEGVTEFAEGFDSATKTMCYVEGVSQGINAASGAMAGAQLMGMGFWNWALGIASIAAGISSGAGAIEQFKMASDVGKEIDIRKETQDFNASTMDMYDEEIDAYDGFMSGVEDLEINMPDDLEVPEETAVPVTTGAGLPEGTPEAIKPEEDKEKTKKPEEEQK